MILHTIRIQCTLPESPLYPASDLNSCGYASRHTYQHEHTTVYTNTETDTYYNTRTDRHNTLYTQTDGPYGAQHKQLYRIHHFCSGSLSLVKVWARMSYYQICLHYTILTDWTLRNSHTNTNRIRSLYSQDVLSDSMCTCLAIICTSVQDKEELWEEDYVNIQHKEYTIVTKSIQRCNI